MARKVVWNYYPVPGVAKEIRQSQRMKDSPYGQLLPCPGNEKTGLIDQIDWR